MIHSVQITIVNLDRNEVNLAQGWYVDCLDAPGASRSAQVAFRFLEVLPDNPFETSEIGAGALSCL